MKYFLFIIFLFLTPLVQGAGLQCGDVYKAQNSFLENHILFSKHNSKIEKRTLNEFIKTLDREKIYFLKSDYYAMLKKNKHLFRDLKKGNCDNLYFIYDLYVKRIQERLVFARKTLNNHFHLKPSVSYITDSDKKRYSRSKLSAEKKMSSYLQYQVANVFMIEEDLNKSIQYVSLSLNNFLKRVQTWKPHLTNKELRVCKTSTEARNFKTCKPYKWLASYLDSFAHSLDSHSSYLDSEAIEDFKISMELSLEGIGATLSSRFGYTIVDRLVHGGAAFRSKKIKIKDKILAVGQRSKKMVDIFGLDLQDVVSMIRGKKRSVVYLKILRETKNKKKKIFTVKLIRNTIDLKEEEATVYYIDKKIHNKTFQVALIKVPSFYGSGSIAQKSVTHDVKKILKRPRTKRSAAIILDLSNNRGGSLDEAVNLTGLFFSKGNVVKQSEKNKKIKHYPTLRDRDSRVFYNGNLVILTNRLSASASEIVSGTLKDYKRAVIVGGDHTFGKGSVQSVEYIRSQWGKVTGAIKTTVGLYFIPSGYSTQKNGVYSDIKLPDILSLADLGEKTLDYTLPSQKIPAFKSYILETISSNPKIRWRIISPKIIKKLRKLSSKRVRANKKFDEIKEKLSEFKAEKNKTSITVAEILDRKDKEEDEDESILTASKKRKKYLERADIEEAVLISIDLTSIPDKIKSSSHTN